ncbi:MAG TPA: 2-dehydropantoate 2-reductase N-terminal domain-containing protein [Polyangiaceae bacterium]|nr:2-dehydropantoate 2-reductase N-terminal domain-containing protein [Polyangiaceae bacterium]
MAVDFIVVGAGSVGLNLAARLAGSGLSVVLVTRTQEQAKRIEQQGAYLDDLQTARRIEVRVAAVSSLEAAQRLGPGAPVLLCTRSAEALALAPRLGAVFSGAIVSWQNHVTSEQELARHCPRVVGGVWRQTCTRIAPNGVRSIGAPRVIVGAYSQGSDRDVRPVADALRAAAFDVGVSPDIMADKWLKLCINLMSIPNALIRKQDHRTSAFVEGKARLLEEAQAVVLGAGIVATSCDGRDRSLDEEIASQRASLARGTSHRPAPVYNQVWRAFHQRSESPDDVGSLEADQYHATFVELGRRHAVPTPLNARVLDLARRAWATRRAPECYGAAELFGADASVGG